MELLEGSGNYLYAGNEPKLVSFVTAALPPSPSSSLVTDCIRFCYKLECMKEFGCIEALTSRYRLFGLSGYTKLKLLLELVAALFGLGTTPEGCVVLISMIGWSYWLVYPLPSEELSSWGDDCVSSELALGYCS